MKFITKCKFIYVELLPIFVPTTMILGFFSKISSYDSHKGQTSRESFFETIGYATLVIVTGVAFPISYPLLGGYYLLKNNNQNNNQSNN